MSDTDVCVDSLTVGSLFSGIGGLDLGFERAGFDIAWQCEKDDYCQKVLNKHWPDTPCYDDISDLYRGDGPRPTADILIGGFPCQDISLAGEGAGLDGERSGLWWEFYRTIRMVRPQYIVVENVSAITHRGLKAILGCLAEIRYDAEWATLQASQFGAPHERERLFLVSYPEGVNDSCLVRKSRLSRQPGGMGARESFWRGWTPGEAEMARKTDGLRARAYHARALGNAVVPQVAEFVAECVREHAKQK